MLRGIDIYEGDNIGSWESIKNQGISVVIQKATEGISHVDSLLQYRYPKIKSSGFKIGFYHFAGHNSPISEAQHFLNTISGLKSDTILWLDIEAEENWDKQSAINYANQFLNYVKLQGYKIGIYTGYRFYTDYLKGNIPSDTFLWIASYGRKPATYPTHSWQYSENGQLSGATGDVDLDYFTENILSGDDDMYFPTNYNPVDMVVMADALNVYDEAFNKIAVFHKGDRFAARGALPAVTSGQSGWFLFSLKGKRAWIPAAYCDYVKK